MTSEKSGPFQEALKGAVDTPEKLVEELRAMAEGQGEYSRFLYVSPWIKGIWNAAADWIENADRGSLH